MRLIVEAYADLDFMILKSLFVVFEVNKFPLKDLIITLKRRFKGT